MTVGSALAVWTQNFIRLRTVSPHLSSIPNVVLSNVSCCDKSNINTLQNKSNFSDTNLQPLFIVMMLNKKILNPITKGPRKSIVRVLLGVILFILVCLEGKYFTKKYQNFVAGERSYNESISFNDLEINK